MKKTMISIGNFFFRFRNQAFPIIIVGLLLIQDTACRDIWKQIA